MTSHRAHEGTHPWRVEAGQPHPLGATWDGGGVNFALFSAHAERVELCLYDADAAREIARVALPECTNHVWHAYLPEARPGHAIFSRYALGRDYHDVLREALEQLAHKI